MADNTTRSSGAAVFPVNTGAASSDRNPTRAAFQNALTNAWRAARQIPAVESGPALRRAQVTPPRTALTNAAQQQQQPAVAPSTSSGPGYVKLTGEGTVGVGGTTYAVNPFNAPPPEGKPGFFSNTAFKVTVARELTKEFKVDIHGLAGNTYFPNNRDASSGHVGGGVGFSTKSPDLVVGGHKFNITADTAYDIIHASINADDTQLIHNLNSNVGITYNNKDTGITVTPSGNITGRRGAPDIPAHHWLGFGYRLNIKQDLGDGWSISVAPGRRHVDFQTLRHDVITELTGSLEAKFSDSLRGNVYATGQWRSTNQPGRNPPNDPHGPGELVPSRESDRFIFGVNMTFGFPSKPPAAAPKPPANQGGAPAVDTASEEPRGFGQNNFFDPAGNLLPQPQYTPPVSPDTPPPPPPSQNTAPTAPPPALPHDAGPGPVPQDAGPTDALPPGIGEPEPAGPAPQTPAQAAPSTPNTGAPPSEPAPTPQTMADLWEQEYGEPYQEPWDESDGAPVPEEPAPAEAYGPPPPPQDTYGPPLPPEEPEDNGEAEPEDSEAADAGAPSAGAGDEGEMPNPVDDPQPTGGSVTTPRSDRPNGSGAMRPTEDYVPLLTGGSLFTAVNASTRPNGSGAVRPAEDGGIWNSFNFDLSTFRNSGAVNPGNTTPVDPVIDDLGGAPGGNVTLPGRGGPNDPRVSLDPLAAFKGFDF